MPTAEQLQKLIRDLFPGLMGVEIGEAAQDKIVAGMLVRPDLCTDRRRVPRGCLDGLRRHRRRDRHRHEPAGGRAHHHHRVRRPTSWARRRSTRASPPSWSRCTGAGPRRCGRPPSGRKPASWSPSSLRRRWCCRSPDTGARQHPVEQSVLHEQLVPQDETDVAGQHQQKCIAGCNVRPPGGGSEQPLSPIGLASSTTPNRLTP